MAVLPGGARIVSVSNDGTAKVWTIDGTLERTIRVDGLLAALALTDGVHFVVGGFVERRIKLYHVDGTLVHTFKGHTD